MPLWLWLAFIGFLAALLALDLGVTRRGRAEAGKGIGASEALLSTLIWLAVAVGVAIALSVAYQQRHLGLGEELGGTFGKPASAPDAAMQFIAAYLVEIALSLDNVAVLALLFAHFGVREGAMKRVLFWAILMCLVARGLMIAAFAQALHLWWVIYLFGGLLVIAMLRTLLLPDEGTDFEKRWLVRLVRALPWARSTGKAGEGEATDPSAPKGKRLPLAAIALAAAAADITFATDSIPAVFSVTRDPVIALTSNLLAVLALRSLYYALRETIGKFRFLKLSVVLVLMGLAVKSFLNRYEMLDTLLTLGAVLVVFTLALAASLRRRHDPATLERARPAPIEDLGEAGAATRRNLRKIGILIAGTSIIFVGILIGVLPGPGPIILIPIGLAILATEFVWAKKLLDRFKAQTAKMQEQADSFSKKTPIWVVPLAVAAFWASAWAVDHFTDVAPWKVYLAAGGLFLPVLYWAWKVTSGWWKGRGDTRQATRDK